MQFNKTLLTTASLIILSTYSANAQNQHTATMNFESSQLPYNWHTSAWSDCNGVCFIGEQSRSVDCKDNAGYSASSEADCSHTPKPANIRECDLPPCAWVEPPCRSGNPYKSGVPSFDGSTAAPLDSEYYRHNSSTDLTEGFKNGAKVYEYDLAPPEPENSSSSSGGGGSVLCGHFYSRGILSDAIYKGDVLFAQKYASQSIKRGYRLWAVPLTRHLNNNPDGVIEKIVRPFVVGWATEMAYKTGYHDKGSFTGKILLTFAAPIVNFIGLFVEDTEFNSLKSEQYIAKICT